MAMVTPVHLGGRLLGGERLAQGDGDESGGADQSRGVEAEADQPPVRPHGAGVGGARAPEDPLHGRKRQERHDPRSQQPLQQRGGERGRRDDSLLYLGCCIPANPVCELCPESPGSILLR